ncbi:glycosyltransferase family 9 protein [Chitiniphilus eburneus]|uniref:Glycosyltransferase family 9 protein n=1 Tax=Chitiniphilus eburneus TaxID=2571148 RepID=A0A4V5MRS3_9NEIS|nr:glycosyltransferase family 9 protein [Chitiniphilus eburneus]TJZ77438.1 glycosyltransferase family 9 protein [Chitiniphilus eburneus]
MRLNLHQNFAIALTRWLVRRQPPPDPAELGTPRIARILAVSCTAIGDALMSTPALHSLRLAYPDARIDLLVHPAYAALLRNNPDIDGTIVYDNRWREFWPVAWRLRRQRYDLVAILHGNEPQATPLAVLSGARWRFKLPNDFAHRDLLSNAEPVHSWGDFTHGIDQRLAVAALAGGAPTERAMTLIVAPDTQEALDATLARDFGVTPGTPLLAFQPGASTASRRWRPERYAELGRRLLAHDPALRIVITGSPAELPLIATVAQGIGNPTRVLVTAGKLPLVQVPALLRRCRVLVTPDTGIMHMAIAVGTPTVSLFAAAHWERSGPTVALQRHIVIQKWRTCDPCLGKRCPYAAPLCMDNIGVDEVYDACLRHLETPAS